MKKENNNKIVFIWQTIIYFCCAFASFFCFYFLVDRNRANKHSKSLNSIKTNTFDFRRFPTSSSSTTIFVRAAISHNIWKDKNEFPHQRLNVIPRIEHLHTLHPFLFFFIFREIHFRSLVISLPRNRKISSNCFPFSYHILVAEHKFITLMHIFLSLLSFIVVHGQNSKLYFLFWIIFISFIFLFFPLELTVQIGKPWNIFYKIRKRRQQIK